ncbi:hypothetical protein MKW98_003630, partial [Papaver atlanticum]
SEHELVQAMSFFRFVNKVLDLRDNDADIQRFHLDFGTFHPSVSKMHRWIGTAVSHNVQKLKIESRVQGVLFSFKAEPKDGFEIPPCLCTCKSLTKLKLVLPGYVNDDDKIILPHEMSLPQLKSLHPSLEDMAFDDEKLTNKFFSSFPSLESLIMEMGSTGFHNMNLHISLPKLEYFQFGSRNLERGTDVKVKLHAPSLSSFVSNSYISTSFTLENLSSLAIADIKIRIKYEDQVSGGSSEICAEKKEIYAQHTTGLLRGIQNVKVLKLDDSVLKALGGAPDILNTQLPEFRNLQHLKLQTYLPRDCLRSIFYILKNSPNIESVSLPAQRNGRFNPPLYPYFDEGTTGMQGFLCGCVNELKFLEILLKHAMVLEKVILTSNLTNQDSQGKKRMMKFSEMLLKFPTASKKILFLLNS